MFHEIYLVVKYEYIRLANIFDWARITILIFECSIIFIHELSWTSHHGRGAMDGMSWTKLPLMGCSGWISAWMDCSRRAMDKQSWTYASSWTFGHKWVFMEYEIVMDFVLRKKQDLNVLTSWGVCFNYITDSE